MVNSRRIMTIAAMSLIFAGTSSGVAWAGGPGGDVAESNEASEAVGTGIFDGGIVGFVADGATNEEASARVIAACEAAGGQECTSDEVTNEDLCIVSIADDASDVVAGGAGKTTQLAREDAFQRAAANGTPLSPSSPIVISSCH